MSVRRRLAVAFGAVGGVMLLPALLALAHVGQLRDLAVEGRSGQASAVAALGRMQGAVAELDRLSRSYVATADADLRRALHAANDSLSAARAALGASPWDDRARPLDATLGHIAASSDRITRLVDAGDLIGATDALDDHLGHLAAASAAFRDVAHAIDTGAAADFARARSVADAARAQTMLSAALAVVIALLFVWFITQALTRPVRALGRAMAVVADGSFETPRELPYQRSDEIGELARSFRTMADRLAELDRTKGEFLGIASHELKTPLNVILAYTELIEDQASDRLTVEQVEMLEAIAEQARIMTRLVSRLMDISRLETGTYRLAPEPILTEDLATQVRRMFERRAQDEGVGLVVDVRPSAPKSVMVDVDIVRDEILGNLILNGIRYTPEGAAVEVVVDGDERGVVFVVRDEGPGIPPEHAPFVFEKHYTVERTRRMGSGLGLAIAREMAELHGGLVTLDPPTLTGGATFRVGLPRMARSDDLEIPAPAWLHRLVAPDAAA